ncbi:MAG: gliding motility-associated C-terminal domain-containing protein [Sphingobacterium sp.]|jgi:gliding motility-associated-like protein|nr:gliding motility-associated C-terminal domain-containing protein [Sphingobacterium sp.]
MKSIAALLLLFISILPAFCQDNKGSAVLENSIVKVEQDVIRSLFSETVYFGPQADWTIDGTLDIWCQRIWIAPGAKIQGKGSIRIYDPSESPYYNSLKKKPTIVDGNNGDFIKLLIEHHNSKGIILENIDDPGYGIASPSASEGAALNIGGELRLAVDGTDIQLNGYNIAFDKDASISQYSNRRKLVTHDSYGHVSKILTSGAQFLFPIATPSHHYAPVMVSGTDKEATIYARMSDYFGSIVRHKDPQSGIDLNWQVYASQPLNATLTLTHPMAANKGKYVDEKASIYQFTGLEDLNPLPTKRISEGIHQSWAVPLATNNTDYTSWFTKSTVLPDALFIPNTFTPNGDGVNDRFVIQGLEDFDAVILTIFNRWGNSVYHHERYDNRWDGSGLNVGTYYYVIETKKGTNSSIYKGWVLLIKEN